MSTQTTWLDHVRFVVSDPLTSEFIDPLNKTYEHPALYANISESRALAPEMFQERSIPTIIIDDYSVNDFDPLSEITLVSHSALFLEGLV